MRKNDAMPIVGVSRAARMAHIAVIRFGVGPVCAALIGVTGIVVGCGDSSDNTAGVGGTGGSSGSGGSGGAAGAPSDGGVRRDGPLPPRAQASVSLHLTDMDIGAARCLPGQ